jgi:methionyl-tRNA formyltransferase
VAAAILAGDEVTGVSIMLMDKGMDTGPVLAQRQWTISGSDTTGTLMAKLAEAGADLLMETLSLWLAGRITPQPQDNAKATCSRVITKDLGRIDWLYAASELSRMVRAFQPWPGCSTVWQGKLLKIVEAVPMPGEGEEGRVVEISGVPGVPVGVQTGSGTMGLLKVQLEGRRVMSAGEFIRGQRGFVGSLLPG